VIITPEMQTPSFLNDSKNFYTQGDQKLHLDEIKELRIGKEFYVKQPARVGGVSLKSEPGKLVGYEVGTQSGEVLWPAFEGLIEEVYERNNLLYYGVVLQFPSGGSEFCLDHQNMRRFVTLDRCRSYDLHWVLRPQKPPLKQMLTSVNLHRLAMGKPQLAPCEIDDDILEIAYHVIQEHHR